MAGALGSGMDIVIQLSADLIERTVRRRFASVRRSCFETTIDVPGYGDVDLRKLTPSIDAVRLGQQQDIDGNNVIGISIDVRLLYGEAQISGNWVSLESLQGLLGYDPRLRTFSAGLQATDSGESDIILAVELGADADELPDELRDVLDIRFRLPLDFLNQRLGDPDDEDAPRLLLAFVDPPVQMKVMPDGALALGVGVTLSQDVLPGDDDEDSDARGGTPGHCGLPDQPEVWEAEFAIFQDEFTETFLDDADWGIALDAHVLDAVLRGLPSAGLNRYEEDPEEECENEGSIRFACLRLDDLRDGDLSVSGRAQIYVCPDNPAPDGWWEVCFTADATLDFVPGQGIVGRYTMHRDVEVCGSDSGWTFWIDVISVFDEIDLWDYVPEEVRQGSFTPPIPDALGSRDDPTGRLRVSGVRVRTDGLAVIGTADVRSAEPRVLRVPERVLFGDACAALANTRDLLLTGFGRRVSICPLAINDLPPDDPAYVQNASQRFAIVSPEELMEGGDGVRLDPAESVSVRLLLDGESGERYAAQLDIPNNVAETTVRLEADLRSTRVTSEVPRELLLHRTQYARPCNQGFPLAVPVREAFEITHEGPGFLHICDVAFFGFEEGIAELDERGEPVLDGDGQPVYRWIAIESEPHQPDGTPVFQASYPRVSEPGTSMFTVGFLPGETHAGRRYRAQMRIVTNAGNDDDFVVEVTGHLERLGEMFGALGGGFDTDVFCGDADWDRVQDTGGELLDPSAFQDLFELLGGEGCCPPPRGPACLCIDLLELSFAGLPMGVDPELRSRDGQVLAHSRSGEATRTLFAPVARDHGYALGVGGVAKIPAGASSTVQVRRWILQQDAFYPSSTPINALAVLGAQVFAASAATLDIIDLSNRSRPSRAGQWSNPSGRTTAVASVGPLLLVGGDELGVYSVQDRQLHRMAGVELPSSLDFFLAEYRLGTTANHVWGWGDGLIGARVGPAGAKLYVRATTRVRATAGFLDGDRAFLFGREGIEVFDLSSPNRPVSVKFLPADRPIRNAFAVRGGALLVLDDGTLARVPLDGPSAFRIVADWYIEEPLRPFVPLRGGLVPYGPGFLALERNGLGFRVTRLRRNRVHAGNLEKRRARNQRSLVSAAAR